MKVLDILSGTSVDGPGLRTSIYFAGCSHACPGCHNPQSWDFAAGNDMSIDEIMAKVLENEENVTLSGGDPLQQPDDDMLALLKRLKAENLNVWCFTGYTWEELMQMPEKLPLLQLVDVLVDSPFIMAERNTDLRFRGSNNQRLLDVAASLAAGIPIKSRYQVD